MTVEDTKNRKGKSANTPDRWIIRISKSLLLNLRVQTPGLSAPKRMLLKHLRYNSWLHSFLTPVAGSNLLEEKVSRFSELSHNSNSEELFQGKTSNLVKWTNFISADYSFKFSAFNYTSTSGAFPCTFLFRTEPFKYLGDLWIHSTAPRNEHSKADVPRFEISEIWDFSGKVRRMKTFFPSKFDSATGVSPRVHIYF